MACLGRYPVLPGMGAKHAPLFAESAGDRGERISQLECKFELQDAAQM